jgi:hypothetical protein
VKHKKTSHKNAPAPRLLDEIGATNLTLADAIAEVVANSFDAAADNGHTEVDVSVSTDEIIVLDNGIGMTESTLVEAVKLGKDMSKVVKRRIGAKGHFGLGMKTACASLGKWWSVRTRPVGAKTEYEVVFDLAEWERRPDDADSWTIEVEEWSPPPSDSPLGNRPNGTAVTVRKLRTKTPMAGAVLEKMGEAFKPHLTAGDTIRVNGDPATARSYQLVSGSRLPVDIVFGANSKFQITGWVALDRQTHNNGDYGFNIYRHGQLVMTWCQDWFPAHLMTSRIVGEVHMDFIDATFFKQGLQQSDLWRQASAEMKEFLRPIVKASRAVSRQGNVNRPATVNRIVSELQTALGIEPQGLADVSADASEGDPPDGGGTRPELPRLRVEHELVELEGGHAIKVSSIERELPGGGTPFDYLWDGTTLLTVVNTAHPLFDRSKDKEQLTVLGTSDSILRYLINECGTPPLRAAEVRAAWILAAVSVGTPRKSDA